MATPISDGPSSWGPIISFYTKNLECVLTFLLCMYKFHKLTYPTLYEATVV
jgi:hypothetical protein